MYLFRFTKEPTPSPYLQITEYCLSSSRAKTWFPTGKAFCKCYKSETCLCPWILKFFSATKYFDYKSNETSSGRKMSAVVSEQRDVWFD